MRYVEFLDARLRNTVQVLGLGGLALGVLQLLARLDLDSEFASSLQERDPHGRSGVLSWSALVSDFLDNKGDVEGLERAVRTLGEWGLVQIVGQSPRDPVVPGPSPLRLTFAGRSCIGLAPGAGRILSEGAVAEPWRVFHSASQERLYVHVRHLNGAVARDLIAVSPDDNPGQICGRVAMQLCQNGGAAVDGFALGERQSLLGEVMQRTATARCPRYLLVPDPSGVRAAAVRVGAALQWVEPDVDVRREKTVLDFEVSQLLGAENRSEGRVIGVPDSTLAVPRRVTTGWDQLIVPRKVAWELRQVLVHARFRLESDVDQGPTRGRGYRLLLSGLPGTGKSMCAEALANTLDRPLVKLDLSSVLSKWLGETEKLLGQVFDVAEASRSVLVLDEAEALLRQRDSGKGGGGMGALSTGVAYLLTRLDSYTGVLVATTNRTKDLDEAFFRRFDDFVVLPIPDGEARLTLWKLALGEQADQVDLDLISSRFAISGGLIKSAAIRARAWAVGLERPLDTVFVLASMSRELDKNDRSTSGVLIEPYRQGVVDLLEGRITA